MRCGVSAALVVLGLILGVAAVRIPLEAGGILLAPMMLGLSGVCFLGAVTALVPPWRSSGGSFWSALADLLLP